MDSPGSDDDRAAAITATLAAIEQADEARLILLLHPYLHWRTPSGQVMRGRRKVLAMLSSEDSALPRPQACELRDGQIYRWD